MEVARNAPTSHFLPQCPIVRVPDLQLREQIRGICHQQYVGTNSDLQVFVVDLYRNHRICNQLGLTLAPIFLFRACKKR
ncbi:hypothetical protein SALWKB29_1689 [Snodgrassella communis]|jgi:FMN reductase (NADPH)|uniref:Uncharacterized protein n=1 Tax=Snodgrassella communis TaxID=2946699 RepID=A0A836Z5I0_9NEIS|nr:hypothetical protein SALWKB29_1689 [Snodgrassella communis]